MKLIKANITNWPITNNPKVGSLITYNYTENKYMRYESGPEVGERRITLHRKQGHETWSILRK